nr:hypothetical protein [Tanacetum cinerariifolium]
MSQVRVPPGTFTSSGEIGGSTCGFRVQHTAQLDVTSGPESLTTNQSGPTTRGWKGAVMALAHCLQQLWYVDNVHKTFHELAKEKDCWVLMAKVVGIEKEDLRGNIGSCCGNSGRGGSIAGRGGGLLAKRLIESKHSLGGGVFVVLGGRSSSETKKV